MADSVIDFLFPNLGVRDCQLTFISEVPLALWHVVKGTRYKWGLVAVALVLTLNLLSLYFEFDVSTAMLFALPMILNEIFLGIWLIAKGFNPSAVASGGEPGV